MIIDYRYQRDTPVKNIVLALVHLCMIGYVILIFYPLFNMVISSLKATR